MLGVCNTPLRSSPQCYRSRVGMLTIICVDTYVSKEGGAKIRILSQSLALIHSIVYGDYYFVQMLDCGQCAPSGNGENSCVTSLNNRQKKAPADIHQPGLNF